VIAIVNMADRALKLSVSRRADRRALEPLRSVLVPVDLSPGSDRVLARVAKLPLADDAIITVLHVVPSGLTVREQQRAVRDAKRLLGSESSYLSQSLRKSVTVAPVVVAGAAAKEIATAAAAARAELIVMGRGGHRPFRDAFLGSTAERVIRRARLPVLVVRLPPRNVYRHPALALDLDDAAPAVLGMLLRVVRPRLRVMVVHAFIDPYRGMMVYSNLPTDELEERKRELHLQVSEQLHNLLADALVRARIPPEYAPVWRTHVRYGAPRTVIEAAVKKAEPDLLVLGSRGYSGLAQVFLGTVAGDVLREVACDVLVVPPRRPKR
jgi:nucleotide-binding universal stress UspA family protein